MTPANIYPLSSASAPSPTIAASASARGSRHAVIWRKGFPWLVFLAAWLIFFVMDNKLDAPLTSLEDRVVSDVAQQAADGDISHKIVTVIMGAVGVFLLLQNRRRVRVHGAIAALLITYFAWICISTLTAEDPSLTFRRLGGFALSLLLCAGCAARMSVDANSIFVAGIPTLNLIPDVIAELRYHGLEALTPNGRFGGTNPHPNVAAAALAVPLIIFTWLTLRSRGSARIAFGALSLLTFAFFVLTRSRTSMLAMLVAAAFSLAIIVIRHQRRYLPRLLAVVLLVVGVGGMAALFANSTANGINLLNAVKSDRDVGDPTTLTGRVDLWKTCLGYASERPLLGFGFGGFWSAKHIESISDEQKWPINQAHSAYIDQLLSLGYPGAVLHVILVFGCLFVCTARYFRYHDQYGAWAALLVFLAVHGLTEAISLPPGFVNFVLSLMAMRIALIPGEQPA